MHYLLKVSSNTVVRMWKSEVRTYIKQMRLIILYCLEAELSRLTHKMSFFHHKQLLSRVLLKKYSFPRRFYFSFREWYCLYAVWQKMSRRGSILTLDKEYQEEKCCLIRTHLLWFLSEQLQSKWKQTLIHVQCCFSSLLIF